MVLHSKIVGEGTPFLILHGFLGMGDNWKTLALRFSKLGYQLHLIDQRNHGRSFRSPVFNYEVMASDLEAYCEFHQLENVILLGHSMGGKTGMLFAALYPHRLQKLIVADIAPRFYPVHHDVILQGLSSLNISAINSRKEADSQLSEFVPELGVRQFLLKNLYWKAPGCLALRLNLEVLKANVEEVGEALELHYEVALPTLFLRGDRSEYIVDEDEKQISNQFSNFILVTIPNAGHWLHAENPEAFYSNVATFLS
jgi:pimeloyl-ACP methyl ester carboxylesterase